MKIILTIILLLFQFVLLTNCYAQMKEVVFINKKTHVQEVYKLPHLIEISLIDDKPKFFSKVILDSVCNDTFYISNPKYANQKLAVSFSIINHIKVSEKYWGRGFKVFSFIFLSGVIVSKANPTISMGAFVMGIIGYAAVSEIKRKYNFFQFEIKNINK